MNALIGRKLSMTRLFNEEGAHVPVTVIEAGPWAPASSPKSRNSHQPSVVSDQR